MISKTNFVKKHPKKEKTFLIKLNIPEDCIYEISDIFVEYDFVFKTKSIISDEIPEKIKEKMEKYSNLKIEDFILKIEKNLMKFLSGNFDNNDNHNDNKNIINHNDNKNIIIKKDSYNFKFPTNSTSSPNIFIDSLKSNILLFSCDQLNVLIICSRCQTYQKIHKSDFCKKCNSEFLFNFVPILDQNFLGFLGLKGCKFVYFEPSKFIFNCEDCSTIYQSDEIGINQKYEIKCQVCHKFLSITINRMIYSLQQNIKLKEGNPLPRNGTCDHYKKSQRWFRFGCCNSLFPCDKCHDEFTGHASELANRIVCGLCSKEQSVRKECDCGMSMIKKSTKFWEGGKGNRDKFVMSKKDNKKYKK